jgi:limonene-1,2-epoxide hydrolase
MALSDEDSAAVVERYHTPDFVQYNDGVAMTCETLIAHAKPVRRNVLGVSVVVHDALVTAQSGAARYTLRADMRKGDVVMTEIYMFARFAPDGRLCRIDQITRDVSPSAAAEPEAAGENAGSGSV